MDITALLMGLAFAFMWSSAFTSAHIIVQYAPPLTALAVRFLTSGLIGVTLAAALGQSARLSRAQWRAIVVFGICQNALYLGMNFIAMQQVQASLAAIIASVMPLLVALAGWLIFHEKLRPLAIGGLVAGIAGVGLIMGARLQGGVDLAGVGLCVIGVISLTVATLAMRHVSSGPNLLMVVGLQMLVGSVVLAGPALLFERPEIDWNWRLGAAFAYTTLVPGLAATWVWFRLVQRIGTVRAATYHFLNPFFGVAVAAALLGETLGLTDILGVIIIGAGILAVQRSKQLPTGM